MDAHIRFYQAIPWDPPYTEQFDGVAAMKWKERCFTI
jgi:hypothetical protein